MPARPGRLVAVGLGVAVLAAAVVAGPGLYEQARDSFNQPYGAAPPIRRSGSATCNGNRNNLYASAIEAGRTHGLGWHRAGHLRVLVERGCADVRSSSATRTRCTSSSSPSWAGPG